MKEILFATTNPAKVKQLQGVLARVGILVKGVADKSTLPKVIEDGQTLQDNARKKAVAYARVLGETVLSMDNGLYFDDLLPEEQPGTHVRRIGSREVDVTDSEMLDYYSTLVQQFGGTIKGRWEFALCIASPAGVLRETTIVSPRIFSKQISPKMVPGYPLESMQIDTETGKYISEMTQEEQDQFWQRAIGDEIEDFFRDFGTETTDFRKLK